VLREKFLVNEGKRSTMVQNLEKRERRKNLLVMMPLVTASAAGTGMLSEGI